MEKNREEIKQSSASEQEIDLAKLFAAVGKFFVNIWFTLVSSLIWLRAISSKNKYILLAGIIAGFVWAFYNTQSETPYYQGSLQITSRYLRTEVVQNIIDDLNKAAPEELAVLLELDSSVSNQIGRVGFVPLLDESARLEIEKLKEAMILAKFDDEQQRILIENMNDKIQSYEITINTYESKILSDVVDAIGRYCRTYSYVKDRIEIDKIVANRKKEKLIEESIKLDSLKKMIFKNLEARSKDTREGSNNVILAEGESANPLNVFDQEIKFFDQIQAIDRTLVLNENFQIFKGSNQRTTPASPSFIDNAIAGIGYSLGAVYIIIFLIQINQYLNRVQAMQKAEASNENE